MAEEIIARLAGGWAVFAALLLASCVSDVRVRRIPNRLVLLLLVSGLVATTAAKPALLTPARALGSAAIGLAIWLPFYLLRMLGAGDVKLFAAASAWLAPAAVLDAALLSAVTGGVLAIVWLVRIHGPSFAFARVMHAVQQPRTFRRTPLPATALAHRVPYGVAMTAGLLAAAWRAQPPL